MVPQSCHRTPEWFVNFRTVCSFRTVDLLLLRINSRVRSYILCGTRKPQTTPGRRLLLLAPVPLVFFFFLSLYPRKLIHFEQHTISVSITPIMASVSIKSILLMLFADLTYSRCYHGPEKLNLHHVDQERVQGIDGRHVGRKTMTRT